MTEEQSQKKGKSKMTKTKKMHDLLSTAQNALWVIGKALADHHKWTKSERETFEAADRSLEDAWKLTKDWR